MIDGWLRNDALSMLNSLNKLLTGNHDLTMDTLAILAWRNKISKIGLQYLTKLIPEIILRSGFHNAPINSEKRTKSESFGPCLQHALGQMRFFI